MHSALTLGETDFWVPVTAILVLPVVGLLILTLVGFMVAMRLRDRAKAEPMADDFTLEDLRQLHREGKLSAEEFAAASARFKLKLRQDAAPKNESTGATTSARQSPRAPREKR